MADQLMNRAWSAGNLAGVRRHLRPFVSLPRTLLMSTLAIAAVFGAIECGAMLALGSGHGAHSLPAAPSSAPAPSPDAGHDAGHDQTHGGHVEPGASVTVEVSADRVDGGATSAQDLTSSHLEMGCVAPIDLRPIDLAVTTATVGIDIPPPSARPNCALAPEPPVPRSS